MTASTRSNRTLRRPLAIASVLALTSGLAVGFAPAAGAKGNGGNGGAGGVGGTSSRPSGINTWGYVASGVGHSSGGNGGDAGALGTGPIECTDDNLDLLARATGGELHTLEQEGHCLVVHKFATSDIFKIITRPGFPLQILLAGGGGGGGGGAGWEETRKAAGAEPESAGGAGGAGGDVLSADVEVNPKTGGFTYTPTAAPGAFIYTPGATDGTFSDPAGRTLTTHYMPAAAGEPARKRFPVYTDPEGKDLTVSVPIWVGSGGDGGAPGTSTEGNTVGWQGATGGDTSFGDFRVFGGTGGFGGTGTEGSEPGVQAGSSPSPRAGGRKGGRNSTHWGGDLGAKGFVDYAAPGGAGAGGNGYLPTMFSGGLLGNGGNGGAGVAAIHFSDGTLKLGDGGGGGTIDPDSPPYPAVTGGAGGLGTFADLLSVGGAGGAGGDGQDAPDGSGGGGGGGGADGSVTPGESNAGRGGNGGNGVAYVRYAALAAPAPPAAPSVVAGHGSATLTITPLAVPPDYYMLWVAGNPDKTCSVIPPETSCVIEGLENGENYTFLAFAGNTAGESDTSTESLAITPSADAGTLPYTGNNTRGLASLALTMIGLGGATTALTRRRRTSTIN